jgi:hypothetical protein
MLGNDTRSQHFVTQGEQRLNALNPQAGPRNQRIYSFEVVDQEYYKPALESPIGRPIGSNLSLFDLFTVTCRAAAACVSRSFRADARRRTLRPAIRSAWPQRHSLPARRHSTVRPATNALPPSSCVGPNSASVLSRRPRAPAPAMGERSGRPLGLQPCMNRLFETSGCGSISAARCLS